MLSRAEIKEITKLFWTSYGKYMKKHKPLFHSKTKWTNYKTNVKDIYFRLKVDKKKAEIAIEIQHTDIEIQTLFYDQFLELKGLFSSIAGDWDWESGLFNEFGTQISKISLTIHEVNLFNKDTWMEVFLFFEKNQVKFDEFWSEFGEVFKDLES